VLDCLQPFSGGYERFIAHSFTMGKFTEKAFAAG
ncbi:hypothetical protein AVEN_72936-1, partial [Araneus ventricosus]